MPKIYMHYPSGAFSNAALQLLAEELTTAGLECEHLPNTPFVRSTVWIYMNEYQQDLVFVAGRPSQTPVISLEVNVFEGGLNDDAKGQVVKRFTALVAKHLGLADGHRCPAYVLIRESKASNWGVFGNRITLESLRNPPADTVPV